MQLTESKIPHGIVSSQGFLRWKTLLHPNAWSVTRFTEKKFFRNQWHPLFGEKICICHNCYWEGLAGSNRTSARGCKFSSSEGGCNRGDRWLILGRCLKFGTRIGLRRGYKLNSPEFLQDCSKFLYETLTSLLGLRQVQILGFNFRQDFGSLDSWI